MLRKLDDFRWEVPPSFQKGMRVPGIVYADAALIRGGSVEEALQQVANVATLPGIVKYSLAMPDIHPGYGFPIGGVAATDPSRGGVISPGGVGYDINCGIRLMRTEVARDEAVRLMGKLLPALFHGVPSGVGSKGFLRLRGRDETAVMEKGSLWAVRAGYGEEGDIRRTEGGGCLEGADPASVSPRALTRGSAQAGTLGSGNHFLEVQYIDEVYDESAARVFGLSPGLVTVMIHCGSRGLGHQVCQDYLQVMGKAVRRYGIVLPDRQLACAPADSKEGRDYFAAMSCAANYAWANRQLIMHSVREVFQKVFRKGPGELRMNLVFDVAHNIAKFEEHAVEGRKTRLCVHRKGATRAFPAGHPSLPDEYRSCGQPVIIPGDMGSCSYVLAGTEKAMTETWGSSCHGAGRAMSRHAALEATRGKDLAGELREKGIMVLAESARTLGEEAPIAYKDVSRVVDVVEKAGISRRIARLRPIGVIKG